MYEKVPEADAKGKERVSVRWCDVNKGDSSNMARTRLLPLHHGNASGMLFHWYQTCRRHSWAEIGHQAASAGRTTSTFPSASCARAVHYFAGGRRNTWHGRTNRREDRALARIDGPIETRSALRGNGRDRNRDGGRDDRDVRVSDGGAAEASLQNRAVARSSQVHEPAFEPGAKVQRVFGACAQG